MRPRVGSGGRYSRRELWLVGRVRSAYEWVSLPVLTVFLFHNRRFDPAYGLTWRRKFRLARQFHRTTRQVETGTSNRAHMAMAAKIFEIPASVPGVLVEAGCWKGGTTANLSLVAEVVGRDLLVYDSFEGLPAPAPGDRWAHALGEGAFRGELEEVKANVEAWGAIDRCVFRKGWFSETMGDHHEPVVAAFVDVDHQASMHQCVLGLWPHLIDSGYFFVDEYTRLDYCALFFSERFWRTYFDRPPPGLMGAGTGIAVGQYFLGPYRERPPMQEPRSLGWTRKDFYAEWDYLPDDVPARPLPGGGPGGAHGPEGWTTTTVDQEAHAAHKLTEVLESDPEARERFTRRITETEEGRRNLVAAIERSPEAKARLEQKLAQAATQGEDPSTVDNSTGDEPTPG